VQALDEVALRIEEADLVQRQFDRWRRATVRSDNDFPNKPCAPSDDLGSSSNRHQAPELACNRPGARTGHRSYFGYRALVVVDVGTCEHGFGEP